MIKKPLFRRVCRKSQNYYYGSVHHLHNMTAAAANVSVTTLQACRKLLFAAAFVYDAAAIGERMNNRNVMRNEKPFFILFLLPTYLRYFVLM